MTKPNLNAVKEEVEDQLAGALDAVTGKAEEGCCVLSESVKQKPLVYVGFALAVGIVLGAVFLCRKSA